MVFSSAAMNIAAANVEPVLNNHDSLDYGSSISADFDSQFQELKQQMERQPTLPVQLDFQQFLSQLKAQPKRDVEHLTGLQLSLGRLKPVTMCQSILHKNFSLQVDLMLERAQLSQPGIASYEGSFFSYPKGEKWYQHWLKSWLMDDISIEQLQDIALKELHDVEIIRGQVLAYKNKLVTANLTTFKAKQHADIVAAFRQREQVAMANLAELFDFEVNNTSPVNVVASQLPKSFPAPGIYNNQNQTFIYHLQTDEFPEKHMDWLYIHEGIPGHHFQYRNIDNVALCPSLTGYQMPMVSIEGWAAYTETLGSQIGLFKHPESLLYALEWRTLRAIRVLLDIGLHAKGWNDQKAQSVWQQYLPERPLIMKREIARIKRWPVQVITYVYGKHLIEDAMLQHVISSQEQSERKVRSMIFKLSNQPPAALSFLPELLKQPNTFKG
jgi:uncharacterized protein (DUF885 family)